MTQIKIGEREVGENYAPLVIAEIGINHGGSLTIAKKMVDAAYRAGAELIKHQTHIIEDEMSKAARDVKPGNSNRSIYEIMQECSLDEVEEIELQEYVTSKGMIFISSAFSRAAADRLQKMNVPAFKIGSGECNNYPLIEHIARFNKPMIVSTGMNTLKSIEKTVSIIEKYNTPFALLHTTNLYPTPAHLVRLGAMTELADHFKGVPFGLSDHTTSNLACLSAIALGASIVERHFTDHMNREGPDIICSMDERACKELIEKSLLIHKMSGGKKEPADEEKVTSDFAFATVVTIGDMKKGEPFTRQNLWVKRPGTGEISAEKYDEIIGKKATRDISKDEHLKWSDIDK